MLNAFLTTIATCLGMGAILLAVRRLSGLPRSLWINVGLTLAGGGIILILHLITPDLMGLETWQGLGFEIGKHALELLVILLVLVAF